MASGSGSFADAAAGSPKVAPDASEPPAKKKRYGCPLPPGRAGAASDTKPAAAAAKEEMRTSHAKMQAALQTRHEAEIIRLKSVIKALDHHALLL